MIDFQNVSKHFGTQDVLKNASFRINSGEQIGLVGPNGAGKSTIFNLITGEIQPDSGLISLQSQIRIGYLHQHIGVGGSDIPIVDYTADAIAELPIIRTQIHEIEQSLASGTLSEKEKIEKLEELGHLQTKFEHLDGYNLKPKAEAALSGLGFNVADFKRPLGSFSGGWQMRANLAKILISEPDILLLDEPSNYLDLPAVEWLQKFLKSFQGTIVLISHDRYLLKTLTNIIIEVNSGIVTRYAGNYNYYVQERQNRQDQAEAAKKNQDKKREHMERLIDKFRAKSSKASQVQSWIKSLDKMEEIVLQEDLHFTGTIRIPPAPPSGNELLRIDSMNFSYDGKKSILSNINLRLERGEKIGITGYNGTGKTTLLKIIAGVMEPKEGKRVLGHHAVCGYQAQEFAEILPTDKTVWDVVKAAAPGDVPSQKIRNILGAFGFSGDKIDKTCGVLSGGEKIRLCFARIFINPPNLLILDEPTTHLDIQAREALQQAIADYDGTVCIVSHDMEFMQNTATTIIAMNPPGIKKYLGNYDYYRAKLAEDLQMQSASAISSMPEKDADKDNPKEKRKEKAQKRQEMLKVKKALEKETHHLESELEKLEKEKLELSEKLSANLPGTDFPGISRRLAEIAIAEDDLMPKWEESASKLEEFNKEYAKIHED